MANPSFKEYNQPMSVDNKNLPSPIEASEGMRTKNEIMQTAAEIVRENSAQFIAGLSEKSKLFWAKTLVASPTRGEYTLLMQIGISDEQKGSNTTDSVYLFWDNGFETYGYRLDRKTGSSTDLLFKKAKSKLDDPSTNEEFRKALLFAIAQTITPTLTGPAEFLDMFHETVIPAKEALKLLKEIALKQATCHLPTISQGEIILSDILNRKPSPQSPSLPLNALKPPK